MLENRSFWTNEEVTKKRLKVGCLLEYQVESSCQSHRGRSSKLIFCLVPCSKCSLYVLQHQPGLNTSPLIPTCGRCVVVAIARNCGSSTTSNVFCRKINSSESGEGEPFQLQKLKNRSFWTNEEVTKKGLKVGCCLEYQVESSCQSHRGRSSKLFIFCGNVSCKPQLMILFPSLGARGDRKKKALSWNEGVEDVDKILMDLQDDGSVYGGFKEAHECFNLEFHRLQAHSACARIFFIGIRAGTINNERITLKTINGEWSEMPLNCRESLVLSREPVHLQLKRPWDVADDIVGGVAVVKFDEARKATCEGLISRYKPLVISRDEEPVEMRNEFGEVIPVPGHWRVLFDTGNEVATGISRELLLKLNLQPDPNKKRKAKLAGRRSGQFETIQIVLAIRGYQFSVCALVDAPAKGTDLLVGMDVIQQLFDLGYTIGD
ncbi:unnamed protein product [Pocillopora meandrina]|uniref:Uncharacterized protein n=1 Tax=Pocillopora meandrina TaxID=46732 RepID=A0AAU9WF25_9CNID|nr:unnamed protein product [Pocillopora meandrina]